MINIQRNLRNIPMHFLLVIIFSLHLPKVNFATKYAGDFEELGVSARAIGLGGAYVAVVNDASAIYYNPAGSAKTKGLNIILMHCESFGGIVKSNYLGIVFPSQSQGYGIAVLHNGIPKIKLTTLPDTTQPPSDTNQPILEREVNANQFVFYLNFGHTVSSTFRFGINAKMIYQTYDVASCFGMGIDFGGIITLFDGFDLGLRIRNLTTSPLFWDTKTKEIIALHPALGVARTFTLGQDRLLLSAELESNVDEGLTNWQLLENIGIEYSLKQILSVRLGLYHQLFTFGLGASYRGFFLDYAYQTGYFSQARDLGGSQRISGGLKF